MQIELDEKGKLLDPHGEPAQVGWSRHPLLDCNLEDARFYRLRFLQRLRIKRWDYYALFTPRLFFSATIADLGYAGNIFVYILDYTRNELHEEGLVIPLSRGIQLPRNGDQGTSIFHSKRASLNFEVSPGAKHIQVTWPDFHAGRGISADILFHQSPEHESMNIVIPIQKRRFYYNQKTNCLPAEGSLQYGDLQENLSPDCCLGSVDWGRGVWEYKSFWNWASASGFLTDGQSVGLNLGCGFGDLTAATENCLILNKKIHKLSAVDFSYNKDDFMEPWRFTEAENRLNLEFVPFKQRLARTNLGIIFSEVHQMFGRYSGVVTTDEGKKVNIESLIGFAEDHQARW